MNLLAKGVSWSYPATRKMHGRIHHIGFMLDSARCQENRAYYKSFIDFSAARGTNILLWHFSDDQGCSLQFDSAPGIGSPNAYSKTEMRELIQYARQRGVEIVPELASLGHCGYLTRLPAYRHLNETDSHFTGMCPVSDETREIVRALLEETAEIFDSPNFHVGMDEVNIGERPLTRAALQTQTRADLLTDYIQFLHGVLENVDRRMWMWGDMLLKYPEMLERIPRDVVICNWQYRPDASPLTTQTLLDAGFDIMLCSALISHDQPLFPGEQFAIPNIRRLQSQRSMNGRGRIIGHVTNIWTPVRFIANSLWFAVDLAAAIQRAETDVDVTQQAASFAGYFFRSPSPGIPGERRGEGDFDRKAVVDFPNHPQLNPHPAYREREPHDLFAEAATLLIEHAPMRKQWLAVAKLQPLTTPMLENVMALAAVWSRAQDLLLQILPAVQDHLTEYGALVLLIELLAHTYSVAVYNAGDEPTGVKLSEMLDHGKQLLQQLDQTWDRERFANDARKYVAPVPAFQDDHLIPLLQRGLTELQKKLEECRQLEIIGGGALAG